MIGAAQLRKRLASLEKSSPRLAYKPRVEVGVFETREEAVARHQKVYGLPPHGIGLFIVPAKPTNEAEHVECLRRFKEQQLRLVDKARAERTPTAKASSPGSIFPDVDARPAMPRFTAPLQWRKQ